MPKIAVVADVHVGNHQNFGGPIEAGINRRCSYVLDVLDKALALSVKEGCSMFMVAGDFLHYRKPEPQILSAIQDIFSDHAIDKVLIKGNHETVSDIERDHALGPLRRFASVVQKTEVLSVTDSDSSLLCIPYKKGKASEWFDDEVTNALDCLPPPSAAVFHLGVSDDATEFYLKNADDSISASHVARVCAEYKIPVAFAGNWHNRRVWNIDGVDIVQVGALVPTGFNNPGLSGLYGSVAIYDTSEGEYVIHELPGPRFVSIKHNETKKLNSALKYKKDNNCPVFIKASVPPSKLAAFVKDAKTLEASGEADVVEIYPENTASEKAMRKAASVATNASTVHDALTKFVNEAPIDDAISRDDVKSLAFKYLDKAISGEQV